MDSLLEDYNLQEAYSFADFELYLYSGGGLPRIADPLHWSVGIDQYGAIQGPLGSPAVLQSLSSSSIYLQLNQDFGIACSASGLPSLIHAFASENLNPSDIFDDLESNTCISSSGVCIFKGWLNSLNLNDSEPYDQRRAVAVNQYLEALARRLDPDSSDDFLFCYNSVHESFLPTALGNKELDQGPFIGPRNQLLIGLDCLPGWDNGNIKVDESGFEFHL